MKVIFTKLILIILKNYMNFIMIYHFYQKEWKPKNSKRVTNLHYRGDYFIHIRNLKQALNHRLVLKKIHRVNKSNQKA